MNLGHSRIAIWLLLFLLTVATFGDASPWDISTYPVTVRQQLALAQRAFQKEQWEDALRLYQTLASAAPKLPIAYSGVGDAYAKLGDYPGAIAAFQQALKLLSTYPQAERFTFEPTLQAKLATAYHRNGQLDEADALFQKAIKGTGENAPALWYIALGQIETERGNLEQARRYYIVAVQLHPDATAAYNNLGHVLLKLNRIDEADAVFREALTQDATLASAAFGRGEVAANRGQFEAARDFYQHAIQHNSHEPIFHKALAAVLVQLGNTEDAKAAQARYRRMLATAYLRQAHQLLEKQQVQPALKLLQKALEIDDMFMPALKDYAYVQMQLDQLESAKRTYQRVLKFEPASRQALLHLGMIEAKFGNVTAAESHYLTLIRSEPGFMDTYSQLANLREVSGNLKGAEAAFTLGIQHKPTWAPGYWWRGLIRQKRRELKKAETDFRRAIQLSPEIPFPKDALAYLFAVENRNLAEALTLAKAVVELDKRPPHRATLAFVYYRLNRMPEARREIEAAFMQAPKHPYILKIRSEILKIDKE